jgi:site-specific DNA-methyltransferase (adenine-specific)
VERILDVFPINVWEKKDYKWLVPTSKTGVFELGIYVRLMKGLATIITDQGERRKWIVGEMIWSFCPTLACTLHSQRNYLGKVWNDMRGFMSLEGHVQTLDFLRAKINENGEIMVGKDIDGKEKYVKFDCIVGNPPYQDRDKNGRSDPKNIYPDFVLKAMKIHPEYMSMVIPARWMSGSGKGIATFLETMIGCKKIAKIVSNENPREWFPKVDIKGGTMFFLYDGSQASSITNINGVDIDLDGDDIISTDSIGSKIKSKVLKKNPQTFEQVMLGGNPYGIVSNFKNWTNDYSNAYICYCRNGKNYIDKDLVLRHTESIPTYRVCVPRKNGEGSDGVIGIFTINPNEVVSETYLVLSSFDLIEQTKNAEMFFQTRTAQYLISLLKKTQDMSKRVFKYLPYLDFTKPYTDQELYTMFDLSEEEIDHIENVTKDFPIFKAKIKVKKSA